LLSLRSFGLAFRILFYSPVLVDWLAGMKVLAGGLDKIEWLESDLWLERSLRFVLPLALAGNEFTLACFHFRLCRADIFTVIMDLHCMDML
jgi:hypothetical protein